MNGIPWKELIELGRFALWIALAINIIKLFQVIVYEVIKKNCTHCGRSI